MCVHHTIFFLVVARWVLVGAVVEHLDTVLIPAHVETDIMTLEITDFSVSDSLGNLFIAFS